MFSYSFLNLIKRDTEAPITRFELIKLLYKYSKEDIFISILCGVSVFIHIYLFPHLLEIVTQEVVISSKNWQRYYALTVIVINMLVVLVIKTNVRQRYRGISFLQKYNELFLAIYTFVILSKEIAFKILVSF